MPDRDRFLSRLDVVQRRLRQSSIVWAMVTGAIAASGTAAILSMSTLGPGRARLASVVLGIATLSIVSIAGWRFWTVARVARTIEARHSGLDNLVVTAEELIRIDESARSPHLRQALFQQAADRLANVAASNVQSLAPALISACTAFALAAAVLFRVPMQSAAVQVSGLPAGSSPSVTLSPTDIRVVVTPPIYAGRPARELLNPTELEVLEGTTVRLEAARTGGGMQIVASGMTPVAFARANDLWLHEFVATDSTVFLLRRTLTDGGPPAEGRLLQVRVEPDRRPLVRIVNPAKDLVFGIANGRVPIGIEARDDLALATLALRYTKVSGSGETFSFEEGQLPVKVRAEGPSEWRGETQIDLDALKLVDGDTLVYRAIATDRKPGADPSMSDTYLIEIGKLAGVASTGFAVDEDRDRQGLSQQMLIIKTERLHASRNSMAAEAFQEQSRLLAVEQRMVKAEFVFMTGGEVADEIQEAEHAHELAEGRFENTAQVELLTAIREMSRAEARLNAADTERALTNERAALRALQRAFDRRRYLLRTLPERARIDLDRRLTGDVSAVQPATRASAADAVDEALVRIRQIMSELEQAINRRENLGAALASKTLAIDPSSKVLQQASMVMASGGSMDQRTAGARSAHRALSEVLRQRLASAPTLQIADQPLMGRFADELRRSRQ